MPQPHVIEIPGVGNVEFPASMSDADMSAAAAKLYADHQESTAPPAVPRDARGMPKVSSDTSDAPPSNLLAMLGPFAHPETLTDFARLLTLPVDSVKKALAAVATSSAARTAVTSAARGAVRGTAAVGDTVSPDVVGVVSPRAGRLLEAAQRIRKAMDTTAAATPRAAAPVAAPVETAPAALAPETPTAAPVPAPMSPSAALASKVKLSGAEFQMVQKLVERGMAEEQALQNVLGQRALIDRLGLPTTEQVRQSIASRNASGRWPE